MRLRNIALFISSLAFVCACAGNAPKDKMNKQGESKAAVSKSSFYKTAGTANLDTSNVSRIINTDIDTTIVSLDGKKIPHPVFGNQITKFTTLPGIRVLSINYTDVHDNYVKGTPRIAIKTEAGKTYNFVSETDKKADTISYYLVDTKTKEKIRALFLK